jgi:hypothetical protein
VKRTERRTATLDSSLAELRQRFPRGPGPAERVVGPSSKGRDPMGKAEVLPIRQGPLPSMMVQVAPVACRSGNNVPTALAPEHGPESAPTWIRATSTVLPATPVARPLPSLQPVAARTLPSPTRGAESFGPLPKRGQMIGHGWQVEQLLGMRGPVVVLAARCVRSRARVALRVLLGGPRADAERLLVPPEHAGRVLELQLHGPLPFVVVDHLAQAVSFWPADTTHRAPAVPPTPPPAPRGALLAMGIGLAVRLVVVAALVIAAFTLVSKSAVAMSAAPANEAAEPPTHRSDAQRGVAFRAELAQDRAARQARALLAEAP